jgi:hypothetical protein
MKCISVEVKGSDTDPVDIDITPGLTAGAILTALQLEDYVLCTAPNAHHGFAEDDEVFSQVNDRDTLYALTRIAVADNFMEYIAFGEGLL